MRRARDELSLRRSRGVSLLEMLLVLALIALTGTLAAMALTGGTEGMRLRAAAKDIAAQLRYTRALAISSGEAQRFTIDPTQHRFQAPQRKPGVIPEAVQVQFIGARQAQARDDEGGVLFFPDGASTGGQVKLQAKSASLLIDVTWLTGKVSLSRDEASP